MNIFINNIQDYSKKERSIKICDEGIYLIEGNSCYEKLLCNDLYVVQKIGDSLAKIMFGWKEEYLGSRKIDGERYNIVVDINHKKKKYKIQNKFPDNWEEFIALEEKIIGGQFDD